MGRRMIFGSEEKYLQGLKSYVIRAKSRPCEDCKVQYSSWVMQFDHREPEKKRFDLSRYADYGINSIKKEIEKCDVVCANCHAERTQRQQYKKRASSIKADDLELFPAWKREC